MKAAHHYIPEGDPGIDRTLREMRRLALSAVRSPRVIAWAQGVVRHVPERDVDAEAGAFLSWVRQNTRYTKDPIGVELVKTPAVMLAEFAQHGRITADCDEQVTLLAAGLNIVGIETRFTVIAADPGSDEFSHVLVEYLSPRRGWVSMDPIVRGTGLGWFPPHYSRLGHYEGDRLNVERGASLAAGPIVLTVLALCWLAWRRR